MRPSNINFLKTKKLRTVFRQSLVSLIRGAFGATVRITKYEGREKMNAVFKTFVVIMCIGYLQANFAMAQEGNGDDDNHSISYPRVGGLTSSESTLFCDAVFTPLRKFDQDDAFGSHTSTSFTTVILTARAEIAEAVSDAISNINGLILSPEGFAAFQPDQSLSALHFGHAWARTLGSNALTSAFSDSNLTVDYRTSPSQATPSPENMWATTYFFMYFEFTDATGAVVEDLFFQRIVAGDNDLECRTFGEDVYLISGTVSASNELSERNYTKGLYQVSYGGVNSLIEAQQRVRIDSGDEIEIPVLIEQVTPSSAQVINSPLNTLGSITGDTPGVQISYFASAITSVTFFGRDEVEEDTEVGGPGGGPGSGGGPGGPSGQP